MKVSRRDFLQSSTTAFGVSLLDRTSSQDDLEKTIKEIRANILAMINEEREVETVSPVALDDLATEVATKHAWDLVRGKFISHWGSDGLKAYHRYSFAGGTEATAENVSGADNTWSMKDKDLKQDTAYLHLRLYQEKPPNDGHRQTILNPEHTHVGIGIVVHELRLRMVELFVSRYVDVKPVVREAKPGASVLFAGKIRGTTYRFNNLEVHYEPLPEPPALEWLRTPRSYSLPKESRLLRPKLPSPLIYLDGTSGVVKVDGPDFSVPVKLYESTPGIYTIVTWIRRSFEEPAIPVTAVCVKAVQT
jgi:uncharacterized protein YkwD